MSSRKPSSKNVFYLFIAFVKERLHNAVDILGIFWRVFIVTNLRILKHADGSVAGAFDEDIEDDDENLPSSSHDDTSSDSEEESTEFEGGSSGDDYVERSFQVLFINDPDIPEVV